MRGKWNWMALGVWVFVGYMMVGGLSVVHAATYDATGTWTYTTSGNWVISGTAGCSADSDETIAVSVTQSGDNMSFDIDGQVYAGTVSDATYTGTASYPEDGGTTTTTVMLRSLRILRDPVPSSGGGVMVLNPATAEAISPWRKAQTSVIAMTVTAAPAASSTAFSVFDPSGQTLGTASTGVGLTSNNTSRIWPAPAWPGRTHLAFIAA